MSDLKDIKTLQATGQGPAPCARFCEATAFNIEIAGWRRDQAENLANQCKLVDQIAVLTIARDEYKLRMQRLMTTVSELTVSRDAYAKAADTMAAAHKVERDELSRLYENTLKREYALHEAARLALDALEAAISDDRPYLIKSHEAIRVLKAVL